MSTCESDRGFVHTTEVKNNKDLCYYMLITFLHPIILIFGGGSCVMTSLCFLGFIEYLNDALLPVNYRVIIVTGLSIIIYSMSICICALKVKKQGYYVIL